MLYMGFILLKSSNPGLFWVVVILLVLIIFALVKLSKSIKNNPFGGKEKPYHHDHISRNAEAEITEMRDEKVSGATGPAGPGSGTAEPWHFKVDDGD